MPKVVEMACDGCGRFFQLGESIYLLHIWVVGRDYCINCRDKIVAFLDTFPVRIAKLPLTDVCPNSNQP